MAQRYADTRSHERMAQGLCPECGDAPDNHLNDNRFWIARKCDLLPQGVADRIQQYRDDQPA